MSLLPARLFLLRDLLLHHIDLVLDLGDLGCASMYHHNINIITIIINNSSIIIINNSSNIIRISPSNKYILEIQYRYRNSWYCHRTSIMISRVWWPSHNITTRGVQAYLDEEVLHEPAAVVLLRLDLDNNIILVRADLYTGVSMSGERKGRASAGMMRIDCV